MSRLQSSLLVGSLAMTACAGIYGVGELSAGAEDAGASGSARPASAGGEAHASAGRTNSASDSGSANSLTGGGTSAALGMGGDTAVSGFAATSPAAGAIDYGLGGPDGPPSCVDLPELCGSSESVSRDCCASLEVEGGSFFRSYDALPDGGWNSPESQATISTYRLDAYEVTVGRFRRFLAAYPWRPAAGAGHNPANSDDFGWSKDWNALLPRDAESLSRALERCGAENAADPSLSTWTVDPGESETLPINCLTWFEAFAFCAWDGGRLPSEAEWNYAAAGGDEARVYPWKSSLATDIDSNYAVYQSAIAKVGSKSIGNGRFGQADLAGNVWEWNVDWYRERYSVPCHDCAEVAADASVSVRVLRGGAYYNQPPFLRVAPRGNAQPSTRDSGYGVRCARE